MKCYMNLTNIPDSGIITRLEGSMLRIFFDFTRSEKPTSPDNAVTDTVASNEYSCQNIDIKNGRSYANIVASIVNNNYTSDDVQAIIADYELAKDSSSSITDAKRAEYESDYNTFQILRAHAKEIATKVISAIGE